MQQDALPPGVKVPVTPPGHVFTASEATAELKYLRRQMEEAHRKFSQLDSASGAAGMATRELLGAVFVEQARMGRRLARIEKSVSEILHLLKHPPKKRKGRR